MSEKISSLADYKKAELSPSLQFYWKILEDTEEIEVVVKSKSKSWVAVGWRHESTTKECKSFWGEQSAKVPKFRFKRQAEKLTESEIKKFTPRGDFHEMDCTDIVIGVAKGSLGKVMDSYTRDRSTPLADEMYGGKNDLTSAMAYEDKDGTTLVFR